MLKKKRITILLTICFILTAGTIYTVTYLRPRKEEVVLLEEEETSNPIIETEASCAELSPAATDTKEDQKESEVEEIIAFTEAEEEQELPQNDEEPVTIVVHICGEINTPGVYEIAADARLNDVIELAGGFTKDAASEYVNLAQTVADAQQYYIPSANDVEGMQRYYITDSFGTEVLNADTSAAGSDPEETVQNSEQSDSGTINVNTATREELMTLSGVGEAKADAIIAYRETVSPYETTEDIMKVDGIKEGLFQKISSRITVK